MEKGKFERSRKRLELSLAGLIVIIIVARARSKDSGVVPRDLGRMFGRILSVTVETYRSACVIPET